MAKLWIDESDALKILDALTGNEVFHRRRDEMNSALHLAKETRFSPLTSETISARERMGAIISESQAKGGANKQESK